MLLYASHMPKWWEALTALPGLICFGGERLGMSLFNICFADKHWNRPKVEEKRHSYKAPNSLPHRSRERERERKLLLPLPRASLSTLFIVLFFSLLLSLCFFSWSFPSQAYPSTHTHSRICTYLLLPGRIYMTCPRTAGSVQTFSWVLTLAPIEKISIKKLTF